MDFDWLLYVVETRAWESFGRARLEDDIVEDGMDGLKER